VVLDERGCVATSLKQYTLDRRFDRVRHLPHEEDRVGGDVTDQEEEGAVERDLPGSKSRHLYHHGPRGCLDPLLIHGDCAPVVDVIDRDAHDITRAAAKVGYRSLRYDGLKKVLLGLTTIDEIEQNTSFEWSA